MAKLAPDPQPYGDAAFPVRQEPFSYIVGVHWEDGPIVIAEVPDRLTYLASLTPPDPFWDLFWSTQQPIAIGDEIKPADFAKDLTTTADAASGATRLVNLGATEGPGGSPFLRTNDVYPISGDGIQSDTTFTYTGGRAGNLSKPTTKQLIGSSVTFAMNWLYRLVAPDNFTQRLLQYSILIDTSTTAPVGFRVAYAYDGSLANREHTDHYYNTQIAPILGAYDMQDQYLAAWWGGPSDLTNVPLFYNGQRLVPPDGHFGFPTSGFWPPLELTDDGGPIWATVLQVKIPFVELAQSYIVNFDRVSDVAIMQIGLDPRGDFILPGYLPGRGVELRGYSEGAKLVVASDWSIEALDPATDLPLTPSWTATVAPNDPAPGPGVNTQIAHFNKDGLL